MKSERRHELQTNDLADWLGHKVEAVRPYSKAILAVLILVAAIGLTVLFVTGRTMARSGAAWAALYGALADQDVESLADVARRYPGDDAGLWAVQRMADMELERGTNLLLRDKETALEALQVARNNYESVAGNARTGSLLQQRALFGLAQTHESLGEFEEARQLYGQVAQQDPESALGRAAAQHQQILELQETQEFYAWFQQQDAAAPMSPGLGLPDDLGDLSDHPDFSLPDRPDLGGSLPDFGVDLPDDVLPQDPHSPLSPDEQPPLELPADTFLPEGSEPAQSTEHEAATPEDATGEPTPPAETSVDDLQPSEGPTPNAPEETATDTPPADTPPADTQSTDEGAAPGGEEAAPGSEESVDETPPSEEAAAESDENSS